MLPLCLPLKAIGLFSWQWGNVLFTMLHHVMIMLIELSQKTHLTNTLYVLVLLTCYSSLSFPFLFLFLSLPLHISDNIECRGEFILEQASYCHYQEETRNHCGPSPNLILAETNLTEGNGSTFCRCVYRLGKTICAERKEGGREKGDYYYYYRYRVKGGQCWSCVTHYEYMYSHNFPY